MFYLLQNMSFTLITGVGKSAASYQNNMDGQTGQGVLQGSSSAAPIYISTWTFLLPLIENLAQEQLSFIQFHVKQFQIKPSNLSMTPRNF
jgi:hypothetical protein